MPVLLADDDATRTAAELAKLAQRCAPQWPVAEARVQVLVARDGHVLEATWLGASADAAGVPCLLSAARDLQFQASVQDRRTGLVLVRLPGAKVKTKRSVAPKSVQPGAEPAADWSL